jgi:hypothetical protein
MISLDDHAAAVNAGIAADGYAIVRQVLPREEVLAMRERWLGHIASTKVRRRFVRGELVLGEPNFLSYSDIAEWSMYRHFDFPWNAPTDPATTDVCLAIHRFRNRLQGFDPDYGLAYNPRNYGIYVSTSLYPPGGMLAFHADGHSDVPILHFMLPLTFRGTEYDEGGLCVTDKTGRKVDIEALVEPGDLIFFDGRQVHGVETIRGGIGRLAIFAIPTFFRPAWKGAVAARSAGIAWREAKSRVRSLLGRR